MYPALFDARMLAPLVQFLEFYGTRSECLLDRVQIPVELISQGGWIGKKQAYDFTFEVVQQSKCQDAVFQAYLNFQLENLGPILAAMQSCKTVKEALDVATRLGSIAYEGNEYFLESDGDWTWLCYREPMVVSPGQTYINDMTLVVYFHLIRAVVGMEWRPTRLRIKGDKIHRHLSQDFFEDCRAERHSNSTGLAFSTELLSQPLHISQQDFNFESLHQWKFGPDGSEPIIERLHRLISSQFPLRKPPTLQQVAGMLDISSSTIKRELRLAGTSYRGLIDRLRYDLACELLSDLKMSVYEISNELGFSGSNNFIRSFRRMTGLTPGEYRLHEFDVDQEY